MMNRINDYFKYLEKEIKNCGFVKLTEDVESELLKMLSLFKITGYMNFDSFLKAEETGSDEHYSFEYQLYLIFEEISKYVFTVKTYKNWILI